MAEHEGGYPGSPDNGYHSDNDSGGHHSGGHDQSVREQDRLLPIANVSRIMKRAIPSSGKISKDAKETVQECVSEFISFITGEASDKCQREKRKTINGDDILWGMSTLGFEDYIEPLKVYLQRYREMDGEKVSITKQSEKEDSSPSRSVTASMQVMQQPHHYAQMPATADLYYGPQMVTYHQSRGGGSGSGSSSNNAAGAGTLGQRR